MRTTCKATLFSHITLGAVACALMLAVVTPATATPCTSISTECSAQLDIISVSNIGSGSQGTVDLLVLSPTEVQVKVSLSSGVLLVNTGGPHTPFVYNLASGLAGLNVAIDAAQSSNTPESFFVDTGSQDETPYGTFTNGIGYNGTNGGVDHGNAGPLVFDVSATGGINLADFVTNTGGHFFGADVYGTGGNTGGVAADILSDVPFDVSLPASLPLFASGLGVLALVCRRKKKAATLAT